MLLPSFWFRPPHKTSCKLHSISHLLTTCYSPPLVCTWEISLFLPSGVHPCLLLLVISPDLSPTPCSSYTILVCYRTYWKLFLCNTFHSQNFYIVIWKNPIFLVPSLPHTSQSPGVPNRSFHQCIVVVPVYEPQCGIAVCVRSRVMVSITSSYHHFVVPALGLHAHILYTDLKLNSWGLITLLTPCTHPWESLEHAPLLWTTVFALAFMLQCYRWTESVFVFFSTHTDTHDAFTSKAFGYYGLNEKKKSPIVSGIWMLGPQSVPFREA